MLRSSPGFSVVAIVSLALGIGANTAIFQLIDAIRLRHLPIPRAEELADVRIAGGYGEQAFSGLFAWSTTPFPIGTGPEARMVRGLWVSGEAFPVLGVAPEIGRLIGPTDDQRGCAPVVVLNDAFWQSQFGGDRSGEHPSTARENGLKPTNCPTAGRPRLSSPPTCPDRAPTRRP